MSVCLEDSLLVRLVAGELATERRDLILAHVAACADCRKRYEALQATWRALGEWQPPAPARDLWATIAERAQRPPAPMPWARLAAAIALAAGLGSGAALLTNSRAVPVRVAEVSDEQVAEALGLDSLGEAPSALADIFGDSDGEAQS